MIPKCLHLLVTAAVPAMSTLAASPPTPVRVVPIGAASHEGNGIAVDTAGNVYLTGQFQATRFDVATSKRYGELGGIEFETNQRTEFFLMKLDPDLNIVWTRVGGSAQFDFGTAVRIATNGDVVVTAVYQDDFQIGDRLLDNLAAGRPNALVARYDPAGNLLWIQTAVAASGITPDDVEIGRDGSIYVGGRVSGTARFGATEVGQAFSSRAFLAKYSATGEFQWARAEIGSSDSSNTALARYGENQIVMGGAWNASNRGVFLAAYDPNGQQTWLSTFKTGDLDEISDLAVDAAGRIAFSGRFSGETFDLGGGVSLASAGNFFDGYVAMVDAQRAPQWIVPAGTRGFEIEPMANGDLVAVGYHQAPVLSFAGEPLTDGKGGTDAYVGRLTASGSPVWSLPWASNPGELSRAVAVGPDQSIVVTGEGAAASFGLDTFRGRVFVAKLPTSASPPPGPKLSATRDGDFIEVSWPADRPGFGLQGATSPAGPFGSISAETVAGRVHTFRLPLTESALFLRLQSSTGGTPP